MSREKEEIYKSCFCRRSLFISGIFLYMQKERYKLLQGDCIKLLKEIEDDSIDAVVTDPPYQYLDTKRKNCAFDVAYNAEVYTKEIKRVLKDTGFIIMFGRGVPFYKQGVLLADNDFVFKESIAWNKNNASSPFARLRRKHEDCFVFAKTKKGVLRKCKYPYIEYLKNIPVNKAIENIKQHIKNITQEIKKPEVFKEIMLYLEEGKRLYNRSYGKNGFYVVAVPQVKICYKALSSVSTIKEGIIANDVMDIPDMIEGINTKRKYHPTEKPVRLMERLISIVTDEDDVVLDSFMGSGSCGIAALNLGRRFIGMELDSNYFAVAKKRFLDAEETHSEQLFQQSKKV